MRGHSRSIVFVACSHSFSPFHGRPQVKADSPRVPGGDIRFAEEGKELLPATDPRPPAGGHFALRTFRTWLWWGIIRLSRRLP